MKRKRQREVRKKERSGNNNRTGHWHFGRLSSRGISEYYPRVSQKGHLLPLDYPLPHESHGPLLDSVATVQLVCGRHQVLSSAISKIASSSSRHTTSASRSSPSWVAPREPPVAISLRSAAFCRRVWLIRATLTAYGVSSHSCEPLSRRFHTQSFPVRLGLHVVVGR